MFEERGQFNFRLPFEVLQAYKELAKKQKKSLSYIIKEFLQAWYERGTKKHKEQGRKKVTRKGE